MNWSVPYTPATMCKSRRRQPMTRSAATPAAPSEPRRTGLIVFAWLWVGIPLAYGVYELVLKAAQLFTR
ncbi:MFS transporter small subunit [Streptomyces sp. NBC_01429]|uniref:MFS transporter small subunit n=1 Tax=Streptomyces sp. NBC_01429 TaxID=2903862 RepID=UPI003FCEC203